MTSSAPAYAYDTLLHDIIKGIVTATGERPDESASQTKARTTMIAHMVMAYLPRDAVETMLSGLCVSYHHLVLDAVRDALLGQLENMKARTRTSIVSIGALLLRTITEIRVRQREAAAVEAREQAVQHPVTVQPEPPPPEAEPVIDVPLAAEPDAAEPDISVAHAAVGSDDRGETEPSVPASWHEEDTTALPGTLPDGGTVHAPFFSPRGDEGHDFTVPISPLNPAM